MNGNEAYSEYVPNNCNRIKLSKEFLLTLVAYVDPHYIMNFIIVIKKKSKNGIIKNGLAIMLKSVMT